MSKKQKRKLVKFVLKAVILTVVLISLLTQCNSIHNLKDENKALFDDLKAIEKSLSENEQQPTLTPLGEFKTTGYDAKCEHCCGKSDGITASMTKATEGRTVAMNRQQMKDLGIEFGDVIYIDGIGERIVEDTGCGPNVVDVVCKDHAECYKITGYHQVYLKTNN